MRDSLFLNPQQSAAKNEDKLDINSRHGLIFRGYLLWDSYLFYLLCVRHKHIRTLKTFFFLLS